MTDRNAHTRVRGETKDMEPPPPPQEDESTAAASSSPALFSQLGHFQCNSGTLLVSDPGLSRQHIVEPFSEGEDVFTIAAKLTGAKKGKWWAIIKILTKHPDRNAELTVIHEDIFPPKGIDFVKHGGITGIGVDSGQAGFFEQNNYPLGESTGDFDNRNSFFGMCCYITSETNHRAGIIASLPTTGCGVVSSSGWGDGVYPFYVAHDEAGAIVAAKIDFLVEEREEIMKNIGLIPTEEERFADPEEQVEEDDKMDIEGEE